jgi:hypothetical protein
MINFNNLTGAELALIITKKNHVVISIDQLIANTVGQTQNERHNYFIPMLSSQEISRVIAKTVLFSIEDRQSLWNSFVLIAQNLGAVLSYTNPNDVDCVVDIQFPYQE